MHSKDSDVAQNIGTIQFSENDALVYLAVDDLVWFTINLSCEYQYMY